jgi:hypothetical protein
VFEYDTSQNGSVTGQGKKGNGTHLARDGDVYQANRLPGAKSI